MSDIRDVPMFDRCECCGMRLDGIECMSICSSRQHRTLTEQ